MNKKLERFIMVNVGLIIMAIGIYLFLVPANLAVGGVTGLAMVIQSVVPWINLGLLITGFNVVLFVLAFFVIGKDFGGYTIYCSFAFAFIIGGLEVFLPAGSALTDDVLLNLLYGIIIQGVGMALIFYYNASTGGTDIIAKIINKYTHISIGNSLFLADALIALLAGFTFGITPGLYAFLGILINSLVIDRVISGFDQRTRVQVISKQEKEIANYITNDLDRGFTYVQALGGYTLEDKKIITVILTRREYLSLRRYVHSIDENAFMVISSVHETLGNGFNKLS